MGRPFEFRGRDAFTPSGSGGAVRVNRNWPTHTARIKGLFTTPKQRRALIGRRR